MGILCRVAGPSLPYDCINTRDAMTQSVKDIMIRGLHVTSLDLCGSVSAHNVIVSVVPANCVANCRSAIVAGPLTTAPVVEYRDPWHGHTYV